MHVRATEPSVPRLVPLRRSYRQWAHALWRWQLSTALTTERRDRRRRVPLTAPFGYRPSCMSGCVCGVLSRSHRWRDCVHFPCHLGAYSCVRCIISDSHRAHVHVLLFALHTPCSTLRGRIHPPERKPERYACAQSHSCHELTLSSRRGMPVALLCLGQINRLPPLPAPHSPSTPRPRPRP